MEIDYKALGNRIRKLRKELNFSQAELGEESNVEPMIIPQIEKGLIKISLPAFVRIASTLNISLDKLMYGEKNDSREILLMGLNKLLSDFSNDELNSVLVVVKCIKKRTTL